MIDQITALNYAALSPLTVAIRASGVNLYGASFGRKQLTVHLPDTASQADMDLVAAIVSEHNPVLLQAKRSGSAVNVLPTMPRNLSTASAVVLTVDGQALPAACPIGSTARLYCGDTITLSVSGYPCERVMI